MKYGLYVVTGGGFSPDRHAYESADEAFDAALHYMKYYAAGDFEELKEELIRRRKINPKNYEIKGVISVRYWED